MVEIHEIDNIEELSQYRMLWNSLFRSTLGATFFHTYDWLETAWRHFGRNQQLRVLVASAAGQPLGILPLCIRTERYRVGNVRVLTYPLDNWGTWYGPIGPNPCATMMAAMQHLRTRKPRDWDMIELRWIGPESVECGRTARAMRAAGMLTERCVYQTTSIIDLPGDWEQFLAAKSSRSRRDLRRSVRRVHDDPSVEYIRHRPAPAAAGDGDPRWDLYEQCEEVARSSWRGSATKSNTFTHESVRDYYRDGHAAAARLGMVDVNVLQVAGRPAAFLYGYHHEGQVTLHRTGYHARQAENGLAFGLLLRSLEDSCNRGDEVVDFGPGEGEQKRRVRTRLASSYRLTYAPLASWRSQAVQLSRWAKSRWQRRAVVAAV